MLVRILLLAGGLLLVACKTPPAPASSDAAPGNLPLSTSTPIMTTTTSPPSHGDRASLDATTAGDRDFAARLYARVRTQDGNLSFSPTSIRLALAMAYAGARGDTKAQMGHVLGLGERAPAGFAALLTQWSELSAPPPATATTDWARGDAERKRMVLRVANRLWGQRGKTFREDFLGRLRDDYGRAHLVRDSSHGVTHRGIEGCVTADGLGARLPGAKEAKIAYSPRWNGGPNWRLPSLAGATMSRMPSLRAYGSLTLLFLAPFVTTALGAGASGCQSGELANPDGGVSEASLTTSSSGGTSTSGSGGKGGSGGSGATSSGGGSTSGTGAPIVTLATGQNGFALAVDATRVYWANGGTYEGSALDGSQTYVPGQVMAVDIGGGTPVTLAANQDHPSYVAVDDTAVYWTNAGSSAMGGAPATSGEVMSVPLGGGSPTVLSAGRAAPGAIAVRNGVLYWLDTGTAALLSMPVTGGRPQTLATARAFGISGITVDASHVYWPDGNQGMGVFATPLDGGTTTTLAPGANAPLGLAVDTTTLYFSLEIANPGAVMSVPLAGGAPVTLATSWATDYGIAIDDANVYWVVPGQKENGSIMSVPKGGGGPVMLATGPWSPFGLAVDAKNLYWTTREGDVLEMAKP